MDNIFNKLFQMVVDVLIGLAVFFSLKAFVPILGDNMVVVITLVVTAIVAETVEMRFKK